MKHTILALLPAMLLAAAPVVSAADEPVADLHGAFAVENGVTSPAAVAPEPALKPFRRPKVLPFLYVTCELLQAYDSYSTFTALHVRAVEANPVVQNVTGNAALFIGLKTAGTISSFIVAEHLWKNHHRAAAVMTMVLANGILAAVAANNTAVINRLRR